MYLSRITISLRSRIAHKLLSESYATHVALMRAFPTPAGRVLFRFEPDRECDKNTVVLLVQSEHVPRFGANEWPPNTSFDQAKRIQPVLTAGQHLRFRLRANPSVKKKREGRKHGIRQGVLGEENQLVWLKRKGEQGGFTVQGCIAIDEKMAHGHKSGSALCFRSVLFEGTLTVTDAEKFRQTLAAGIGSGKAFGFGLLSVARA